MSISIRKRIKLSAAFSIAAIAVAQFSMSKTASATTDTWAGTSGNDTWSPAGNWTYSSGAGPVATGDTLLFTGVGGYATSNNNTSISPANLVFNNGATAYTLTGNSFTATGTLTLNNGSATLGASDVFSSAGGADLIVESATAGASTLGASGAYTETFDGGANIGSTTNSINLTLNFTGASASFDFGNTFSVGGLAQSGSTTLNMAGLSNFQLTATSGNFNIGAGNSTGNSTAQAHGSGTVTLASTSNLINVGTIDIGNSGGNNGNNGTLNLGAGTNTLEASTITVGAGKGQGQIRFAGANGSVNISGVNGGVGTAGASITIQNNSSGSATTGLGGLFLAGHTATVNANSVVVGSQANSTGLSNAQVTFDTGTFNVQTLILARDSAGTGGANGVFTLGTNSNSTGVLNVNSTFDLTDNTVSGATAAGTLIINGGTANINTNILDASTAGTHTPTLDLNGGTLNMMGNSIGTNAAKVTVNLAAGTGTNPITIANLGGAGINAAGLTNPGTTTLTLAGANTFTGGLTDNGTLQFNNTFSANTSVTGSAITGAGAINQVSGNTTLSNAGNNESGALGVSGGKLLATGTFGATTLSAGTIGTAGTPGVGTLTLTGLTATGGNLFFNVGNASADLITVNGAATLGASAAIALGLAGTPATGSNDTILTSTGLSNNISTFTGGVGPTSTVGRTTLTPYVGGSTPVGDASPGMNVNDLYVFVSGGPASLQWTGSMLGGGDGATWDVQTNSNWWNTGTSAYDMFYQDDNVSLGDTYNGGTQNVGNYNVTLNTTVTPSSVSVNNSNGNYVISGTGSISGIAALTKEGSDSLTLDTVNSYAGGTQIGNGTLFLGASGALPNGGTVSLGDGTNNATLDLHGFNATVGGLSNSNVGTQTVTDSGTASTLTYAQGTNAASTFTGVITGTTLALNVSSGSLSLGGNNTYAGGSTIGAGGTLSVSGAISGAVSDAGTFNAQNNLGLTNLTGAGKTVITAGDTLTLNPTGGDVYTGQISDTGGLGGNLAINAAGTSQTLGGNSSFLGTTSINSGTVYATSNNAFGASTGSAVTVASGATLDIGGATTETFIGGAKTYNISGSGVAGSMGVIQNNGGANGGNGTNQQESAFENVTLQGAATIGGNNQAWTTTVNSNDGRFDIGRQGGALNLGGNVLTKDGTDQISITGSPTVTASGGSLVVDRGILSIETSANFTDQTGYLVYNNTVGSSAGSLGNVIGAFYNNTTGDVSMPIIVNGAGVELGEYDANHTVTLNSNIYLNNNVTFNLITISSGGLVLTGNINDVTNAFAAGLPANLSGVGISAGAGSVTLGVATTNFSNLGTNAGTLELSGTANDYSGGTTVYKGTLIGGATNAFGVGALTVDGGTVELNTFSQSVTDVTGTGGTIENSGGSSATLTMNQTTSDTYAGAITDGGAGSLALTDNNGGFDQTLTGALSYSGDTALDGGGTLQISSTNNDSLGGSITDSGTDFLTVGDGTHVTNLTVDGSVTVNGAITVNTGSSLTDGLTTPLMTDDGQWNVHGASSVGDLSGPGQVDMEANLTVTPTVADALTGSTNITGTSATAELVVDGTDGGSLTLDGANTYAGTTDIRNGGDLALGASASISSPTITVESGSTFDVSAVSGGFTLGASAAQELNGNGTVKGSFTVGSNGNLSPGDAVGPMYVTGSVVLGGTLSLQVDPDTTGVNDELIATGNVTEGGILDVTATNGDPFTAGEAYNLISANSFFDVFTTIELPTLGAGLTWDLTQSSNDLLLSVANTPEPASLGLIAIGGMGLLLRGRKKKA